MADAFGVQPTPQIASGGDIGVLAGDVLAALLAALRGGAKQSDVARGARRCAAHRPFQHRQRLFGLESAHHTFSYAKAAL
jgi:hypothetical protein